MALGSGRADVAVGTGVSVAAGRAGVAVEAGVSVAAGGMGEAVGAGDVSVAEAGVPLATAPQPVARLRRSMKMANVRGFFILFHPPC